MRRLILAAVLVLAPVAAHAQSPNVLEVRWSAKAVPTLNTQLRYTTVIMLPDGDDIMNIACGDVDFWAVNKVGNSAMIKPAKEGAATNVTIFGSSGRVYPFLVRESKAAPNLMVTVTVDEPITVTKYIPAAQADAQVQALQQEVLQAHATVESAIQTAEADKATYATQFPATLKFLWASVPYVRPFLVRGVWTDGKSTFVRTDAPELPALYEIKDGQPSLVLAEAPSKGLYRIDKVMGNFYLQLGKARQGVSLLPGN